MNTNSHFELDFDLLNDTLTLPEVEYLASLLVRDAKSDESSNVVRSKAEQVLSKLSKQQSLRDSTCVSWVVERMKKSGTATTRVIRVSNPKCLDDKFTLDERQNPRSQTL